MTYTDKQITAALVVSDYHGKLRGTRDECEAAVSDLGGVPLSCVLAGAVRQAQADRRRLDYFDDQRAKFMRSSLYWNDPEGPDDDGGWRVSSGRVWPLHRTARDAIDAVLEKT